MAQQPDLPGPTTSYSDPFYDRLESVAQRIAKRMWLILLALVVVVIVAVATHTTLRDTPIAASAGRFLDASNTQMEAERSRDPATRTSKLAEAEKAFLAVGADAATTPYYQARAWIEAAQLQLTRGSLSEAKASVGKARAAAATALDPDLDLAIGLSDAAVLFQSGEYPAAEAQFLKVEGAAGLTHPDRQVAAILGAAQAMAAQNRLDDAIAKLENLASRNDSNATMLLSIAKNEYWALKRRKASPAEAQPAAPAPTPAPGEAAPIAAPAAPAAVAPTPAVVPPAPTPAASPEGK